MADFRPSAGFDPAGFRPSAGSDPVAGSGLAAGTHPQAGCGRSHEIDHQHGEGVNN